MITKAKILQIKGLSGRRERKHAGVFVVEGFKSVCEFIESGLRVAEVYALAGVVDRLPFCDTIAEVTPKEMERISHLKTPSEVLALVEIPSYVVDISVACDSLVLALDDVQDPGNMGTIIRLADWFGIRDIFCSSATVDCFNPKVVQATMGALGRVRVHYCDLTEVLGVAVGLDVPVYGAFLEGENIYHSSLSRDGVVVMGNEGNGISVAVEDFVTRKLFIPPYPVDSSGGESLNVAVATAVVCSEFRRR